MENPLDQYEWSEELGMYVKREEEQDTPPVAPGPAPRTATDAWVQANQRRDEQAIQAGNEMYEAAQGPQKPLAAQNIGQGISEFTKLSGNALAALGTDYGDLAAGIGDTFVQGGNFLQGKGFDFNEWFNDSDNPWTQKRLELSEPETQLGEMARPWIRAGVALLTLPKQALKWGIVKPLKFAAKIPGAGKAANYGLKNVDKVRGAVAAKTALSADDALKVSGLQKLGNIAAKGTNAKSLPESMARSAWLFASYDDIGKAIKAGAPLEGMTSWFDDVARGVKGLGTSVKNLKLRTVGEALAWDAFIAFNMAGEGNDEFDEGFSNFLVDSGLPGAEAIGSPLATTADDNAITRKVKGTLEGTLMGGLILNPLFDIWRLRRFSKYFKEASPELQDQILKKLAEQAQDIGTSMGEQQLKLLPGAPPDQAQLGPGTRIGQPGRDPGLLPAAGQTSFKDSPSTDELLEALTQRRIADDAIAQQEAQAAAQAAFELDSKFAQREVAEQALAKSELRRAEAVIEAEDAATSPVPGMSRADYEVANRASRALMPEKMPGPIEGVEVTGEGIRKSLPGAPDPQRIGGAPDRPALRGDDYSMTDPAGPGGRVGQPGPPVGLQGPIDEVSVSVLRGDSQWDGLPRPAEAVVTPQTLRNAFAEDARKYAESIFVESPDGTFRQMTSDPVALPTADMIRQAEFNVKRMMPRNRVDALEYLQENPTMMNRYFVRDAVDSVWSNFITRKALAEGWATIDPSNMGVKFNRKAAMDMDMADKTRKIAGDLDEAIDLELYNSNVGKQGDDLAADAVANQAQRDATEAAQYEVSEELRLQAAQGIKGKLSDAEIVREMTGTMLDQVERPIVQKAAVGRGWEVIGADGEVLQRTTTKRAANKLADQELRAQKEALVRRARQAEADQLDQGIEQSYEPVVESDIQASIKLTQKQKEEIMRYLPRIAQETIDAPGKSIKRTFDFSLSEIEQLQDGWKAMLHAGDLSPARARVIKNLLKRFSETAIDMQPQVRRQKQIDKLMAQTESYIKNGEICDLS